MREATFEGSEVPVFYRVWAPPGRADRIVIIVHGYAEHGGRYRHVAEALVASGAVVYAPDHIGHGHTGGERALIVDFEHVVDDLHHVAVDAAREHAGAPLVLVGHSMGGLLSARFAERFPDETAGVAFMGAVIGDWDWARRALEDPSMMEVPSNVAGMSSDEAAQRSYADDPLVYHGLYKRPLLVAEVAALDRFSAELSRLTMPILFMHGVDDPFVPYQTSLDAVLRMPSDDVTIRLFKGDRHELVNERDRDEVIAELSRFVERFSVAAYSR
jgi:acylglycerol lipase